MTQLELSSRFVIPADHRVSTRLHEPWLTAARTLWLVLVTVTVTLFTAGLLIGLGQLRTACTGDMCHPVQLSPSEAALNQQLGLLFAFCEQTHCSIDFYAWYTTISFALFGAICFAVGGLIFWRRSDDWMALFVALFLIMVGAGFIPVIPSLDAIYPQIAWFYSLLFILGTGSIPLVLAIFPNGRFVPRWIGWPILVWLLYMVVTNTIIGRMPRAGGLSGPPSLLTQAMLLLGGFAQIYRYRTASVDHRRQTKWVVYGFVGHLASLLALVSTLTFFPSLSGPTLAGLIYKKYAFALIGLVPILFIPMGVALSILRFQLWDIHIILNRTLVYTILSAIVIAAYVLIVGSLSALLHGRATLVVSLIATGIVAVSFHSVRDRVQRAINRMMFGDRDEPFTVLERLSKQLEPVLAIDEVLPTLVRAVAKALRLPYVAIALEREGHYAVAAAYPPNATRPDPTTITCLPLHYQSKSVGQLWLAPRVGAARPQRGQGSAFSAADIQLLETIARQASIAVYNVRLTADLQRSRLELITTREEERRRLRRDLHDGLGPVLAAMTYRLDAIHNWADRDVEKAKAVSVELKEQVQSSLAEIRRIAYDLRPPALDELGLIGALREHCSALDSMGAMRIAFVAPSSVPTLAAAVEVAIYRIAMEGVANVQRHAKASWCQVRLRVGVEPPKGLPVCSQNAVEHLYLEVLDDGCGLAQQPRAGVGLAAMRERTSELGGACVVENRPGGGTRVAVALPMLVEGVEPPKGLPVCSQNANVAGKPGLSR